METASFTSDSSPSSSSSSELALQNQNQNLSKCRICDKPAHGYHHGALTCRACCIFFRRSAGISRSLECIYDGNCEIYNNGILCKKCRLSKCFRSGMHVGKFQLNRESNRRTTSFKRISDIPMSFEKFIGRPHIVISCEPNPSKTQKIFMDLSFLIEKGSNILSKKTSRSDGMSSVEKLAIHMREVRKIKTHGQVVYRKFGKKESLAFWEIDFCRAANWLAQFQEFQQLPISLKMKFLKSIWNVRSVLDRVVLTAEKRLKNEISDYLIPLDEDAVVDSKNLEVDLSWCTHYEKDKLGYFLTMYRGCEYLERAVKLLMGLKPTDVEQNFLFLQICFSYAGRLHRGEIQEVSETLLETVSNQMHAYYSNVLKMPNYSGRISRLLKCEQFVQGFINSKKQKIEIGQIFDIFNVQYSHPEMFINFGYS